MRWGFRAEGVFGAVSRRLLLLAVLASTVVATPVAGWLPTSLTAPLQPPDGASKVTVPVEVEPAAALRPATGLRADLAVLPPAVSASVLPDDLEAALNPRPVPPITSPAARSADEARLDPGRKPSIPDEAATTTPGAREARRGISGAARNWDGTAGFHLEHVGDCVLEVAVWGTVPAEVIVWSAGAEIFRTNETGSWRLEPPEDAGEWYVQFRAAGGGTGHSLSPRRMC